MLRSKEKTREKTCVFADIVARKVIQAYQSVCPGQLYQKFQNSTTVLSAFLILDRNEPNPDRKLQILSLGVGTKYLETFNKSDKTVLRDCHAEILAKKGFKVFLARELKKQSKLFEKKDKLLLRENFELIFYTSSAPCGNSVIKRWAKGRKEKSDPSYDDKPYDYPKPKHEPILLQSLSQGQISPMVKTKLNTHIKILSDTKNPTAIETSTGFCQASFPQFQTETKSCSYKIAKWNLFGAQGKRLLQYYHPIYIDVMVVGRKFSRPHLRRALCCRFQDWDYHIKKYCSWSQADSQVVKTVTQFHLNHPAFLSTSVKLASGAMDAADCASFSTDECLAAVFLANEKVVEVIEGRTGLTVTSERSQLSETALMELLGDSKEPVDTYLKCRNLVFQRLKAFKYLSPVAVGKNRKRKVELV